MYFKVIILDFDGVLVESNAIKDQAFENLFASYPQHLAAILDYHKRTAVIRFEKFRYIYEHILKLPYSLNIEQSLARQFSNFCIDAVIRCPSVKGAEEFLEYFFPKVPLYIISINPADDLNMILKGRGIAGYFKDVYTVANDKSNAIKDILKKEDRSASEVVFIGDGLGDLSSAQKAGVFFIGRKTGDNFLQPDFPVLLNMLEIMNFIEQKL